MDIFSFKGSRRLVPGERVNYHLFRNIKLIFFAILCGLFTLSAGDECYSQSEKPAVLVTVIFAKETEVCAPDGYASNYDRQDNRRKCNPLYFDKLSELGKTVAHKLPPEQIPLKKLYQLVNWYSDKCSIKEPCKDPNDRYAIVMAFEFQMQKTKGIDVSLERKIPKDLESHFQEDPNFGKYSARGKLDEGGHWINHQRADLFLPGYGVEWILTADKYSWTLLTTK